MASTRYLQIDVDAGDDGGDGDGDDGGDGDVMDDVLVCVCVCVLVRVCLAYISLSSADRPRRLSFTLASTYGNVDGDGDIDSVRE
jgi:hypothetical protein